MSLNMDPGLSISEGEVSIEDFQTEIPADVEQRATVTNLPSEFEVVGAIAYESTLVFEAGTELNSRCCPDTSVPAGEDLPSFFNEPNDLK